MNSPFPAAARSRYVLAAVIATACLLPADGRAAESYDTCVGYVDALPAVLSAPGTWCLRKNLSTNITTGAAIQLTSADVVLDCNGFRLLGTGTGTTTGVLAEFKENPVVRRCTVRGFANGTFLTGSGVVVEDNRFEDNGVAIRTVADTGADAFNRFGAVVVRRNVVLDSAAVGIQTYGATHVLDNVVDGVASGSPDRAGIAASAGPVTIGGNTVRNIAPGESSVEGIDAALAYDATIRDNIVIGLPGPELTTGIRCSSTEPQLATGNHLSGWATALDACQATDNPIVP